MDMQQVANAMQITPPMLGGHDMENASIEEPGNVPGAGSPNQQPGSPKVRSNEIERGEGQGGAQSSAMQQAPNPGAQ